MLLCSCGLEKRPKPRWLTRAGGTGPSHDRQCRLHSLFLAAPRRLQPPDAVTRPFLGFLLQRPFVPTAGSRGLSYSLPGRGGHHRLPTSTRCVPPTTAPSRGMRDAQPSPGALDRSASLPAICDSLAGRSKLDGWRGLIEEIFAGNSEAKASMVADPEAEGDDLLLRVLALILVRLPSQMTVDDLVVAASNTDFPIGRRVACVAAGIVGWCQGLEAQRTVTSVFQNSMRCWSSSGFSGSSLGWLNLSGNFSMPSTSKLASDKDRMHS